MNWREAAELGACGGAIFSLYPPWTSLLNAHTARREALTAGKPLPRIRDYVDFLADGILIVVRALFGAIGGAVFHTQLTPSATAGAIAIGASAPLLLWRLGNIRSLSEPLGQIPGADPGPGSNGEASE